MTHRCEVNAWVAIRLGRSLGRYGVRLYRGDPDRPVVVVVSDDPDRAHSHAVTSADRIVSLLCDRYGIDPETLVYIAEQRDCELFRVEFYRNPDGTVAGWMWRAASSADVDRWIGQRLAPLPGNKRRGSR